MFGGKSPVFVSPGSSPPHVASVHSLPPGIKRGGQARIRDSGGWPYTSGIQFEIRWELWQSVRMKNTLLISLAGEEIPVLIQ